MKARIRGSVLIFALLVIVMTTLIGLSLLGIKKGHYSASQQTLRATQARLLAHSGIHDAIATVSRDPFFPSGLGDDQTYFSYREPLTEIDSEKIIGYYKVDVDQSKRKLHGIVTIASVGLTTFAGETSASHSTYVELKLKPNEFGITLWKEGKAP